jgi:hypothetical protein
MRQETRFRVTKCVWGRETETVDRFLSQRAADAHVRTQTSYLSERDRASVTFTVTPVTIELEDTDG